MPTFSTKKIAIDKANATIFVAVAITAFVMVFSLVAMRALYSQMRYQNKVSSKKEQTLKVLKENVKTADKLTTSYRSFAEQTTNILGGNPQGDGPRDGDNPRIILDALPSKYDFPALTTSIEKLLKDNGYTMGAFTGTDDEIAQSEAGASESPQPIEMPFDVEVVAGDQRGKDLMQLFERSIRPFQVKKLLVESQNGELKLTITTTTFYQPEKSLNVKSEVVK